MKFKFLAHVVGPFSEPCFGNVRYDTGVSLVKGTPLLGHTLIRRGADACH